MKIEFLNYADLIVSILTLCIAFFALHSWKKQFNKSLQRDFVLTALDAIHDISQLNFTIVKKFNDETEKNNFSLLQSKYYLNPIYANYPQLIDQFSELISKLDKALNRMNKLLNDPNFEKVSDQYQESLNELGIFFQSEELIGNNHPEISKMNQKGWTTSWLDKACDQEMLLEYQIEDYLLKLLKI